MDETQQTQDEFYWFPYHYIAQFKPYFTHTFVDTWGINYAATLDFLMRELEQLDFKSVIDVGCGDGRLVKEIDQKFPKARTWGVDYSAKAIAMAKAMHDKGEFLCQDIVASPLEQQFDLVTLIETLEHIPPQTVADFIEALARLCHSKTSLLLTVPHQNEQLTPQHFQHFTVSSLTTALEKHFTIVEIKLLEHSCASKAFIDLLLTNRLFILNNKTLLNKLYNYYKKKIFFAQSEATSKRIFVRAVSKSQNT